MTELETLAVVWAVKHYRTYLYGYDVQVITDHSAVKALLAKVQVGNTLDGGCKCMGVGCES